MCKRERNPESEILSERLENISAAWLGPLRQVPICMDRDMAEYPTPPADADLDEGLDSYDKELAESFPASDVPESVHP